MIDFCHKNRVKSYLLCGMCFLTFFFLLADVAIGQVEVPVDNDNAINQQFDIIQPYSLRLVFWNVENLFDTRNDSCKNDDAFTPKGENHWTGRRYQKKLNDICRVLATTGERDKSRHDMPQIIGLAEVENDKVLHDLCEGTPLRQYGYSFVHYDSPDARGIDNALLYRNNYFNPFFSQAINVCDSNMSLITRDILLVEGVTTLGDTLIVLVNHFPSKRGGASADIKRRHVAERLRFTMDSLQRNHPMAAIVVMGDFNASPDEPEIAHSLMQNGRGSFVNLMAKMTPGSGSHNYQGQWEYLDQIMVSGTMLDGKNPLQVKDRSAYVLAPDFMLVDDERNLGKKPLRTYLAMKYLGGYSDHLPVGIDLIIDKK